MKPYQIAGEKGNSAKSRGKVQNSSPKKFRDEQGVIPAHHGET